MPRQNGRSLRRFQTIVKKHDAIHALLLWHYDPELHRFTRRPSTRGASVGVPLNAPCTIDFSIAATNNRLSAQIAPVLGDLSSATCSVYSAEPIGKTDNAKSRPNCGQYSDDGRECVCGDEKPKFAQCGRQTKIWICTSFQLRNSSSVTRAFRKRMIDHAKNDPMTMIYPSTFATSGKSNGQQLSRISGAKIAMPIPTTINSIA